MFLRKASIVAVCLLMLCAVPALAQTSRLYFAGALGLNILHDRNFSESTSGQSGGIGFNNGPSFSGALGLRVTENIRIEGELSYRNAGIAHVNFANGNSVRSGSDIKTWLLMLNAYYDFSFNWHNISPYLTAGIGVARHNVAIDPVTGLTPGASGSDTAFAYQAGTGLKYRVNPDMALTGGYRYLGTSDINAGSYKIDYHAHEFRMGLEYDLPVGWLK
jgi:OmpA-OmpF porin, OOP family